MMHLLDVNILIALGDANHAHRDKALRFFQNTATREGWATCPLTENAFIRILGSHAYPGGPASTTVARVILTSILRAPGHQFWPDDMSLADSSIFPTLPASKNLTDCYLLALAVNRGAHLVTLDHGINGSQISGGEAALLKLF